MADAKEAAVREAVEVAMAEVLMAVAVRAAVETESPHGQRC